MLWGLFSQKLCFGKRKYDVHPGGARLKKILYFFRNSRNFRIELCLASLALLAGIIFQINFDQFFILFVTIFSVLILELLNTAIESVVDLIVENRFSKLAEIAKDCSAGSVLLSALNAIFVAVYIFFPRIKLLLNNF